MRTALLVLMVVASGCDWREPSSSTHFRVSVEHTINMNYVLHVYTGESSVPMQSIEIRNGVDPTSPDGMEFVDLNSDLFPDLKVLGGITEGAEWHKVWYFDPRSERFVWSHTTDRSSEVPNQSLNRTLGGAG